MFVCNTEGTTEFILAEQLCCVSLKACNSRDMFANKVWKNFSQQVHKLVRKKRKKNQYTDPIQVHQEFSPQPTLYHFFSRWRVRSEVYRNS